MGNKLDRIVCLDCELTCWPDKKERGDQRSEIIQIGICSLNVSTKTISQEKSYYIKPKYSSISNYCTALTGITKQTLKGAIPLSDACNSIMKTYGTRNRPIACFGNDTRAFREDCILKCAEYPFSRKIIDVSLWAHLKYFIGGNHSLEECLSVAGLRFEGQKHNAVWDSYNTGKLLIKLID